MWQALDRQDEASVLKYLRTTEYPREISCRKNAERTKYPIHAAVVDGMMDAVAELANPVRYAGVFSQRNAQGYAVSIFNGLTVLFIPFLVLDVSSIMQENRSSSSMQYAFC